MRRGCPGAVIMLAAISLAGPALSAPPVPAKAGSPARPMEATLAEVAVSIRRFEEVYRPESFGPDEIEAINLDFDRVVTSFFRGRYRSALEEMDAITARLRAPKAVEAYRTLLSLGMEVEPMMVALDNDQHVRVRLASLYPAPESVRSRDLPVELALTARDNGETIWRETIRIRASTAGVIDWRRDLDVSTIRIDDYRTFGLTASCAGAPPVSLGMVSIGPRSLADLRRELEAALDEVADPALSTARLIAQSRCSMLVDHAPKSDLTRWVVDRAVIAKELRDEVGAIGAGVHPYRQRAGDLWCALPLSGATLPCRLYVPAAARAGEPLPLVVALHGAGGNEHMFFEAYGAGMLPRLAEEHGFIAIAPLTYPLFIDSSMFPAMLEVIESQFAPIDRERVYVLGHSMGAMTAAGLASAQGDAIAAIVPIAGNGRLILDDRSPPCRAYAAEHDTVLDPDAVRRGVELIKSAHPDAPIEFTLVAGTGHMLIVNQVLEEAIEWMLTQRR